MNLYKELHLLKAKEARSNIRLKCKRHYTAIRAQNPSIKPPSFPFACVYEHTHTQKKESRTNYMLNISMTIYKLNKTSRLLQGIHTHGLPHTTDSHPLNNYSGCEKCINIFIEKKVHVHTCIHVTLNNLLDC